MRILVVTQYFWPENFKVNDLVLGLQEKGHEVVVLTGKPNYPSGRFFDGYGFWKKATENYRGVRVLRVPLIPRGTGSGIRLLLNYVSFCLSASVAAPLRCRGAFDLIFVYEPSPITVGFPAVLMKKIKRAPLFFWIQDLWPESLMEAGSVRSPRILDYVAKGVRYLYRNSDLLLAQSLRFRESIEAFGAPPDKIVYYPNWAESYYRPLNTASSVSESIQMPEGFKIMFAGNFGAAQDIRTILDAAGELREHSDIQWVFLGDGRMRGWLEQEIVNRGLQQSVHLLGRFPPERMPDFFAKADALLVTLKKSPLFNLTIPSKLQSYLACGRPVIAALDGEGARILRDSGGGIVCPAESPTALAAAALQMKALSVEERLAMGESGIAYYRAHFERNMLIDKLDGWIGDYAGRKPAAEGEN
ncbi:glycosyltransferase family 4 protein [Saccharibacillus sp. CPCC 101409]|uniref:glycosyltransferase family 4 protein n=1 Tax=Saccharibacillus sp. CPCC 101409 TaxID=3058041 RepID=UPI002672B601|nr:glycosyltransferase family 4 protein [Saccharibacillus sp. CPCC 101409]MDO3412022.1 glycosyltransferase family 4 protein [Saccharibacillus sp. CPCC 101409]